jgi:hypothetical protein
MNADPLDQFITNLAAHLAHTTELPRDQAEQLVANLVARSRAEYRATGAAAGDEVVGFLRWLSDRVAVQVDSAEGGMANEEHVAILRQGVEVWNAWRGEHPDVLPDLSKADLSRANLIEADLRGADLSRADLSRADLSRANLIEANLIEADLNGANLMEANLSRANLMEANLSRANLSSADVNGANFNQALIAATIFAAIDLSTVGGLDTVRTLGPSTIGIDTLYKSNGKIPEAFLRGCGVPEPHIEYLPSLLGAMQPIQFYSCFISYSSKDEDFARRLHERMQREHLRVWFAPEDIKGGEKLHEQIERAIQMHDRLLLVLSEQSIQSEWVLQELRRARRAELRDKRRKLFPIRLMEFEALPGLGMPRLAHRERPGRGSPAVLHPRLHALERARRVRTRVCAAAARSEGGGRAAGDAAAACASV